MKGSVWKSTPSPTREGVDFQWAAPTKSRAGVALRSLILDRLEVKFPAMTVVDKLHVEVVPGHDLKEGSIG